MQQLTFLNSLNDMESAIEEINGAYECRHISTGEKTDRKNIISAFKSIVVIKREFYKKIGMPFTSIKMEPWKEDRIARSINPNTIEDVISVQKFILERSIKHLKSKGYLMSDSGVRINLESKTFQNQFENLSECISLI